MYKQMKYVLLAGTLCLLLLCGCQGPAMAAQTSAEYEGKTAVLLENTVLKECYSAVTDENDSITWVDLSNWELGKGDMVLVLAEAGGRSQVCVISGDAGGLYGELPSKVLSQRAEDLEMGNIADAAGKLAYRAVGGDKAEEMIGYVTVLDRQDGWCRIQPLAGGDDRTFWIPAGELSFCLDRCVTARALEGEGESPDLPFADVGETSWCYPWVKSAWEMGLVAGLTSTSFGPEEDITCAQAIAFAARVHQSRTAGTVTLTNGTEHWYDSYVNYCTEQGILTQSFSGRMNDGIDRQTCVSLFARALPGEAGEERNSIPAGAIPDVSGDSPCSDSIYRFYRMGILNGTGPDGAFQPESRVKRSEIAAMLVRMMEPARRVDGPSGLQ